jgi:TATA-binding protein-associated factor
MVVPSLPKDWVATPFMSLLFQNLVCEERSDIRTASLSAWKTALSNLSSPGRMDNVVTQQTILDWYAIVMTPLGVAIDTSAFHNPSITVAGAVPIERHNVDKNMLAQDLSLITAEITLKARIAAATALSYLMIFWPTQVVNYFCSLVAILTFYVLAKSHRPMLQARTTTLHRFDKHASESVNSYNR